MVFGEIRKKSKTGKKSGSLSRSQIHNSCFLISVFWESRIGESRISEILLSQIRNSLIISPDPELPSRFHLYSDIFSVISRIRNRDLFLEVLVVISTRNRCLGFPLFSDELFHCCLLGVPAPTAPSHLGSETTAVLAQGVYLAGNHTRTTAEYHRGLPRRPPEWFAMTDDRNT